jgi:uncharacterized hydantoinase/oxoprolinase family protein
MLISIRFVGNDTQIELDDDILKLSQDEYYAVLQDAVTSLQSLQASQYSPET